jgi:hypothetical protein
MTATGTFSLDRVHRGPSPSWTRTTSQVNAGSAAAANITAIIGQAAIQSLSASLIAAKASPSACCLEVSANGFRVALAREGSVSAGGFSDAVYPVPAVTLRQQPSAERNLLPVIIILVDHVLARIVRRRLPPNRCSRNVLANRAAIGLASGVAKPAHRQQQEPQHGARSPATRSRACDLRRLLSDGGVGAVPVRRG